MGNTVKAAMSKAKGGKPKVSGATGAPPAVSETRRDQILDTAAFLFASRGFRTSLQEVAEACGILPGSLYHHFDSKEAIVVELVQRYQHELDVIAGEKLRQLGGQSPESMFDHVVDFGEEIAACAVRHRAALVQTLYEPASNASPEFIELTRQTPKAIDHTMLQILRLGSGAGQIRGDVDLVVLAEQICHSMMNVVGVYHQTGGARNVPRTKCQMLLRGLSPQAPDNSALNRSAAFQLADKLVSAWQRDEGDDLRSRLRIAARGEFGRRGYQTTTIRNIAAAANMSTGAVYRLVRSKEELLDDIMKSFEAQITESWDAVFACDATATEKLDAFCWLDINLLARFGDELKIQLSWLTGAPPTTASRGKMEERLKYIGSVLEEGERSGEFRVFGGNSKLRALCLVDLTWISEQIIRSAGTAAALSLARETLIRGAIAD